MTDISFSAEIEGNRAEKKVNPTEVGVSTSRSEIRIRERGAFVTRAMLYSPDQDRCLDLLYASQDLTEPKLTASHTMMPVGPSEGIGGQHGYPRWADYRTFYPDPLDEHEKRLVMQAKRSDNGLSTVRAFELGWSHMALNTIVQNPSDQAERTSIGEHLYFELEDENFDGLRIGGLSLDELLGEGSQEAIAGGQAFCWDNFKGAETINFPAGHSIDLNCTVNGASPEQLGMLIWHRECTDSICFEPTLGYSEKGSDGVLLNAFEEAQLSTTITLK